MGADYNEIICTAIDTIVNSRIQQLQYDITKVCQIEDASNAAQGKYIVADGAAKYEAFTNDTTLRKGNSVQVLIPNGDYNMQKTIISKVAANDTTPYNYVSPMDAMVKITDNVFLGVPITGILANEDSPNGGANISKSILIHEISGLEDLGGYTRLGIEVDLRTWLPSDTISGTYGIQIRIFSKDKTSYELQPFTNNEMYGNPYSFIHNFTQEMVYDISWIDSIETIQVFLFQDGKFQNDQGQYIPWQEEFDGELVPCSKNIFVDDLRIYLGYDKKELSDNFIQIYSSEGLVFGGALDNVNIDLTARWFHKNKNGDFDLYPESIIQEEAYEIKWFEYTGVLTYPEKSGDEKDVFYQEAGLGWHLVQDYDVNKPFKYSFMIDSDKKAKKSMSYKAICYEYFDYGTSDSNRKSNNYFISNTLVFTNRKEVADQATITANNALTINCLDGSEGNYFLYNSLGQIIRNELGRGTTRYIQASFSDRFLEGYEKITGVRWILPSKNTMLDFEDVSPSFTVDGITINGSLNEDVFTINLNDVDPANLKIGSENFKTYLKLPYSIKNQQSYNLTDNTVNCEIELDGITFYSVKQFVFGRIASESNGLSLSLNFENNKTALIAQSGETLEVKANLYYFGNEENFYFEEKDGIKDTITWSWYRKSSEDYIKLQEGLTRELQKVTIGYPSGSEEIKEDYWYILQATFERKYGNTGSPYKIIAYLPIPLRASSDYINLDGATEVIYETTGKPTYMTTPYYLNTGGTTGSFFYEAKYAASDDSKKYLPTLAVGMDGVNPALKATDLNIKISDDRMAVIVKNKDDSNKIVWSQPILIQQNQTLQSTEKTWNADVIIGSNSIKNTSLGRGSVDKDGKVSGIFIGDKIQKDNGGSEVLNTGIYGAQLDALSYYLDEFGDFYFNSKGLIINPTDSDNKLLQIKDTYFDSDGILYGDVSVTGTLQGDVNGTLNGSITGTIKDKTVSYGVKELNALEEALADLKTSIGTLSSSISSLDARIKALENK